MRVSQFSFRDSLAANDDHGELVETGETGSLEDVISIPDTTIGNQVASAAPRASNETEVEETRYYSCMPETTRPDLTVVIRPKRKTRTTDESESPERLDKRLRLSPEVLTPNTGGVAQSPPAQQPGSTSR